MKPFIVCVLLLGLLSSPVIPDGDRGVFGVRIAMDANSHITTFIAMRYSKEGILREKRTLTRDEFIKFICGEWPSNYNPTRENLFEKNGVQGGMLYIDTLGKKIPYCPALDSLWKIRYPVYPFKQVQGRGWSAGIYRPSLKQEKYFADRYHIKQMDFEYVSDTNFWKLLKDVSDTIWVEHYKGLTD